MSGHSLSDGEAERWAENISGQGDTRSMVRVGQDEAAVETSSSDSDDSSVRGGSGWRRAFLIAGGLSALGVLGVWGGAAVVGHGATRPSAVSAADPGARRPARHFEVAAPRSLLEAPETVDLVVDTVRGIKPDDLSEDGLRAGVQQLLRVFSELVEENLDDRSRMAFKEAHFGAAEWRDVAKTLRALRDIRLQKLGHEILQQVRSSNSSVSGEVQEELKNELLSRKGELVALRQDVTTSHLAEAVRKWARRRRRGEGELELDGKIQLWSGMFSPEALSEMRRQEQPLRAPQALPGIPQSSVTARPIDAKEIGGHMRSLVARVGGTAAHASAAVVGGQLGRLAHQLRRRLNSGTWANPKINTVELTFSIIAVGLMVAMEVVQLVEIFKPDFEMPTWGWLMLVTPTEGAGVATCMIGLTVWCDIVLGALGINVLQELEALTRG